MTKPSGLDDSQSLEPRLSAEEREELAGIAYLLAQLETLRGRGLIAADACEAVAAEYAARRDDIQRRGRCEAALHRARGLKVPRPADALSWAERARQLDPARQEAWTLAIDL